MLIEPVRHELPSLALMKISTMHKLKGDTVKFYYGSPYFTTFIPDIIYVSTLFTWDFRENVTAIRNLRKSFPNAKIIVGGISATLSKGQYEVNLDGFNVELHTGLWDDLNQYRPDYSLFPDLNVSICRTTRGCIRKCPWCMVKDVEPQFEEIREWWRDIDITKEKIIFYDNNFFASSPEHFDRVMDFLEMIQIPYDFNQALDVRLFDEYKAKRFSKTKVHPLRFAFDSMAQDKFIQKGILTAFEHDVYDISVLMLYNFNENPEEIYYRVEQLVNLKTNKYHCNSIYIFPMKYQPLDTLFKSDFVGQHWTQEMLNNFNILRSSEFANGVMRFNNPEHFYKVFGKDAKEFVNKLKITENINPNTNWRKLIKNADN